MFRPISILALLQLLLVMLGFLALGIVLKMAGYPDDPPGFISLGRPVWSPLALLLRRHGLVLLFVPIVWSSLAVLAQNRRVLFSQAGWLLVGMLIAVGIIVLFILGCVYRYAVVPN